MPRSRRNPRPLDPARLEELALAYAARFATSAARLEQYLARKLRERGWEAEGEPPLRAIVEQMVGAGYVDDASYARARTSSLLRRGYGPRRISQTLSAAGIAEEVRQAESASQSEERRAALALARKRGFGPFGPARPDRARREKQLAAMLRAGHRLDSARELVNAADVAAAEAWADEGEEQG